MTAGDGGKTRKITIEPLTRVEGHGKVTLLLDDNHEVAEARLHIVEFEASSASSSGAHTGAAGDRAAAVRHLSGEHHLAAAKAMDRIVGGERLTPTAEKVRRLMHYGQIFQSHACTSSTWRAPTCCSAPTTAHRARSVRRPSGVTSSRSRRASGAGSAGRADETLRPGGHPGDRRQAYPRHRCGAGGVNKGLAISDRDALLRDVRR